MPQRYPLDRKARPDRTTPTLPAYGEQRSSARCVVALGKVVAVSTLLTAVFVATAATPVPTILDDACALADVPLSDALVHVPFETVDGRIYVQARVNGRGPFRFAVDTGASGMARADASLVTLLGLSMHGETTTSDGVKSANVETTHLDSLELGGVVRPNLEVIARDYNSRNAPDAVFSGIIAREFFSDGLLVIDYPRKTLTFSRALRLSASGNNALGYERAFRIPVSIGAMQTVGHLDTGANIGFVLPQALYEKVAAGPLEQAGRAQLTNGQIETQRATVHGPFRVGEVSVSDVEVRVSAQFPELLVGAHALQNAVVLIDQRSKTVAVCD
ncbi:aspartyl protease family protein [Lysobacter sp. A289]